VIDFVLGIYLATLAVRGWLRGLVKELVDLVGLIAGVFIAFRASRPFGDFLSGRFDVGPEVGRVAAGLVLFLLVGLGLSVAGHYAMKLMKLPGLNLSNRLLGSGLAIAWGLLVLLAVVSVVRALPFPPAVDAALAESAVVDRVAGPEAAPRRLFLALAGDEVLSALNAIEPLIGGQRLVLDHDDVAQIPAAAPDEITHAPEDAALIFGFLNRARVDAGLAPLVWSDGLASAALGHAQEMYLDGYVSHVSPKTGTVGDRVRLVGIPLVAVGENIGLASSALAVHQALMESEGHRANILSSGYDRVGIGAVQGPLGLMVVQVFGG
jgi:uncharacterized membrane protein required for colicin V production